jgi:hypothetical protein
VTDSKKRNYITESCSQKIYFLGYLNEAEYMACIKKMSAFNLNILIEEYKLNLCVTSKDTSLAVIFYNKYVISLDIVVHYGSF